MDIDTVAHLHANLRVALQIELATIPPYLYAMYSIADRASRPSLLIRSIVAEEMLHAALVGNIMLATGADPDFTNADLVPLFPMELPHHEPPLELSLQPCSEPLIRDVFLRLEAPDTGEVAEVTGNYRSLGQFYHSLETGLERLAAARNLFATPQLDSQLSANAYSPVHLDVDESGGLHVVRDLETALNATEIIVHQGEGLTTDRWADPDHQELTHYYKLLEISDHSSPLGAILPVPTNPRTPDYPKNLQPVSNLFNATYRYLFLVLNDLFSPSTDKGPLIGDLYALMNQVLSPTAHYLTSQVVGAAMCAAPTFEFYRLDMDHPHGELRELADEATRLHPTLSEVAGAIRRLSG